METKSLLIGIISFISGGLLVSIAAVTFEKDSVSDVNTMSMDSMTESLRGKTGDDFDTTFISEMIVHHEGAVEMAELAKNQAKHDEIKQLSEAIISAQNKEITEMKSWQRIWGYTDMSGAEHGMD